MHDLILCAQFEFKKGTKIGRFRQIKLNSCNTRYLKYFSLLLKKKGGGYE